MFCRQVSHSGWAVLTDSTIWVWITERVIEIESEKYKAKLDKLTSFGEMIQLELKQYVFPLLVNIRMLIR